jgi:hypothetical protein
MARSESRQMKNSRKRTRSTQLLSALRQPVLRDGFHDALFNQEYDRAYDAWSQVKQERYELGRRCGAVYKSMVPYNAGYSTVDQLFSLLKYEDGLNNRFYRACVVESQINDHAA